jgi:hypothetical protein
MSAVCLLLKTGTRFVIVGQESGARVELYKARATAVR